MITSTSLAEKFLARFSDGSHECLRRVFLRSAITDVHDDVAGTPDRLAADGG